MGWLVFAAVLVGLALLPIMVRLRYDSGGPAVSVLIGFVPVRLYPAPPKKEKKKTLASSRNKFEKKKPAKANGGSVTDFLPLLEDVLAFLKDLRKKFRVSLLRLYLVLAGDDPADLAINYGRAWAAVGNLMPRLEQFLRIGKRDVNVSCDFAGDTTRVEAQCHIVIPLGRLLWILLLHGLRLLKKYKKILNQRKGGNAS